LWQQQLAVAEYRKLNELDAEMTANLSSLIAAAQLPGVVGSSGAIRQ
jgi:hypothetical protein